MTGPTIPANSGYNIAIENVRKKEFPMLEGEIYLDHAGTTLYPKSLMDRFAREMTSNLLGNPHSASASSQRSLVRIEDIRLRVLQFFNADPDEFDLVFVANATAGIKLVMEAMRAQPGGFDYAYHQSSHTSLVGVREEARKSTCLSNDQVESWLVGSCPFENSGGDGPILFAYPAQSNMDGRRLPLAWAEKVRSASDRKTFTLLDAAAFVSTSPFDLGCSETAPDFTVLSFYKIFGFPDLGALIVKRQAQDVFMSRRYFGGGTVDMVVCVKEQWHAPKSQFLHERLEDGTLPIHNIIALDAALDVHGQLFGSMTDVADHTLFLAKRLYDGLKELRHGNGEPVCVVYSSDPKPKTDKTGNNGPVVAFNMRNSLGAWISLAEVEKLASLKHFHIRTGGLCNPGGIATALGLEPWEMKRNFSSGFRCGTDDDIMSGKPTGVIRVSLGAMSNISDVDSFFNFVSEFYRDELPSSTSAFLRVAAITVYPIKSCGGFEVPEGVDWAVRPEGLAWDREWCLVHGGTGQALSQKRIPRMALIRPSLDFERGELRVTYVGPSSTTIPQHLPRKITVPLSQNPTVFASSFRPMSSRVCGEEILVQTYASPEINDFFSGVLGVPCVLARFPASGQGKSMRHAKAHLQKHQLPPPLPKKVMNIPGSFPEAIEALPPSPPDSDSDEVTKQQQPPRRILLSNESPILAITLASLNALNKEIQARGGDPVSSAVFRANVILDCASSSSEEVEPYAEDSWSTLQIGKKRHEFTMLGSCRRCHMVCINQETAVRGEEPFVTLSKTRRFDGKVFFGTHMAYSSSSPAVSDSTTTMAAAATAKAAQSPTIRVGDVAVAYLGGSL
ncbi:molybdenum cofactor sulfurase [Rhypophila decipiens]